VGSRHANELARRPPVSNANDLLRVQAAFAGPVRQTFATMSVESARAPSRSNNTARIVVRMHPPKPADCREPTTRLRRFESQSPLLEHGVYPVPALVARM
jgi:hypothetical protein